MSKFIICKTTDKAIQSYYLKVDSDLYFLFEQDFRKSNKEYYGRGVNVNEAVNFARAHSTSIRNTMEKLRKALKRIEREEGIAVWDKTERMNSRSGNKPNKAIRMYKDRMRSLEVA